MLSCDIRVPVVVEDPKNLECRGTASEKLALKRFGVVRVVVNLGMGVNLLSAGAKKRSRRAISGSPNNKSSHSNTTHMLHYSLEVISRTRYRAIF
jgi:hypothetical protein